MCDRHGDFRGHLRGYFICHFKGDLRGDFRVILGGISGGSIEIAGVLSSVMDRVGRSVISGIGSDNSSYISIYIIMKSGKKIKNEGF